MTLGSFYEPPAAISGTRLDDHQSWNDGLYSMSHPARKTVSLNHELHVVVGALRVARELAEHWSQEPSGALGNPVVLLHDLAMSLIVVEARLVLVQRVVRGEIEEAFRFRVSASVSPTRSTADPLDAVGVASTRHLVSFATSATVQYSPSVEPATESVVSRRWTLLPVGRNLLAVTALAIALLPRAATASEDKSNFRESVFICEEALGKLEECCHGFDASRVRCAFYEYNAQGCDSSYESVKTEHPAIDVTEAQCILGRSCADLVARGTCKRAQEATPERSTSEHGAAPDEMGSSTQLTQAPVCP